MMISDDPRVETRMTERWYSVDVNPEEGVSKAKSKDMRVASSG